VHLTDLHFSSKTNLIDKTEPFCRAVITDLRAVSKVFFVISGDIAFSGKREEFNNAQRFFSMIKQLIKAELPAIEIRFVIVPGNHDCNFEHDVQLRRNAIKSINYLTLGDDNSVIDQCLTVQKEFWNFYSSFEKEPEDKLFYQLVEEVGGHKIAFHCINTAWMSKLNEEVGGVFFPVKWYEDVSTDCFSLNISVWHHPYNWFNPSTPENNKKEFERFTEKIATLHLFGHEHEQSFYVTENRSSGEKINLMSGKVFNEDKKKASGFQTIVMTLSTMHGRVTKYEWDDSIYKSVNTYSVNCAKEEFRQFKLKDEYLAKLEEVKIPLFFDSKRIVKQSEIFVYPDLDSANADAPILESYLNSSKLTEKDYAYIVLDGDSQIGKSTLLQMLTLDMYEKGISPILLNGKEIKDGDITKLMRKAFRQQYESKDDSVERFMQLKKNNKALLIDDFQDIDQSSSNAKRLFEAAISHFGKVIIILDSASVITPSIKSEFHDVKFYSVKPLGFKKRNELIEKYLLLKDSRYSLNEREFLENLNVSFDNVQTVLGDKLMPSYPIFILSILQALEYKPLKQNETSFGYCYQTLIHYSLHKAGVANDDIDTYFNILTELAYEFVRRDIENMPYNELMEFYIKYQDKFICPKYDTMIRVLKRSRILHESDAGFSFGYDYILYYLSAKKIADIIHEETGKQIVTELFNELHVERNANILVFITHHSKDISFIEESLLHSMFVLDSVVPITLERKDPFYEEIAEIVEQLKNDLLEINRAPKEERDKLLMEQDKQVMEIERNKERLDEDIVKESREVFLPFHKSFRSIEIVGQIIKNRKGSLPKSKLIEMIRELYTTGFRTIGYYSSLLNMAKTDILEAISKEKDLGDNMDEIEKRVSTFVQVISLHACLSVFNKLMFSVGNKDLKNLYKEVASSINSPAAKLVTLSINAYYGHITPEEVKELVQEFKGNIVATRLLRARVKNYIYMKNPDFKIKQKFAAYLDMKVIESKRSGERQPQS